jgi:DNA primase
MIKDDVLSVLLPFTEGKSCRVDCPSCGGWNTLSMAYLNGSVVWNCYKASCDARGVWFPNLSPEERIKILKQRGIDKDNNKFVKPDYWIDGIGSDKCLEYMIKTNMMSSYVEGRFRPMYDPAERRFIFPIKENSIVIGGVGRSLGGAWPKTLNYNANYVVPFTCGSGSTALLVEDCASAVAASRNPSVAGVALLGTNIRKDFIPYLSKYDIVYIALDPDAYNKSLRLKKQLTAYLKDVRVLKLDNDIKDLDDEQYRSLVV